MIGVFFAGFLAGAVLGAFCCGLIVATKVNDMKYHIEDNQNVN